jgi:hypothetical protein
MEAVISRTPVLAWSRRRLISAAVIGRSIVERMGGTITIASELDVGTTVEVMLRRA